MAVCDRAEFLRRGAGSLIGAAAGGLLGMGAAGAEVPYRLAGPAVLTPKGDDVSYLSFATVAERAIRDFYAEAYRQGGAGLSTAERRHIHQVSTAKRAHIVRLDAALGADAPLASDFVTVLPKGAVATRGRVIQVAEQLELLLVRVYLTGVGFAQDSGTRLFLGRLLAYDAQQIAWLRGLAGHAAPAGLLSPIDLEPAGTQLDRFLATPDFQG